MSFFLGLILAVLILLSGEFTLKNVQVSASRKFFIMENNLHINNKNSFELDSAERTKLYRCPSRICRKGFHAAFIHAG